MKITKNIVYTVLITMIFVTITGCVSNNTKETEIANSKNTDSTSFDINVSINISVKLADNLKNINPNIIKAARTALFNFYCDRAKFVHYNGFCVSEKMDIFKVKQLGENSWEVKYRGSDTPDNCYSSITVRKENTGSYKGYMVYSSPCLRGDETF